jgi:hypothetical protein
MSSLHFDIENNSKNYLDEKELFILFYLLKNKRISTYSGVFVPNPKQVLIRPDTTPEDLWERMNHRGQSVIVLNHLLNLGKTLDEKGFSIYCDADYSLVEGGFLTDDFHKEMYIYLSLSDEDRKKDTLLSKEQKDFLEEVISGKLDLKDMETSIQFTKLANPPVECYRECIQNKKANERFIELVNKLITDYDGGLWKTKDIEEFLSIWYQSNKSIKIDKEQGIFYEDNQKKLSRLIFENVDIQLVIKSTEKLENYLNNYLNLYKNDLLKGLSRTGLTKSFFSAGYSEDINKSFYGYKRQKDILIKNIEAVYTEYQRKDLEITNPYIDPEYIDDDEIDTVRIKPVEENKERDSFLFVHTTIALEKEGYLDINAYSYGTKEMFDLYDRGFLFEVTLKSMPDEEEKRKGPLLQNNTVYFDTESSKIICNEQEIKITKGKDIYYAIKYLFEREDVYEECFYDEIRDESELDDGKERTDKNIYDALMQFNKRLINKGINDLFIINFHSIKIRNKYKIVAL